MKYILYAIALCISIIILGYLFFLAIVPIAYIMILIEQHKPKRHEIKESNK